jgi:glycosyltransferase involved in cell wall biosynthesis
MKVLHIIPSIGPLRGGPSVAVMNTCRALADAGVDVTLVTTNDNGPMKLDVPLGTPVKQDKYTIVYFNRTTPNYTFSWPITPWLSRHISEFDLVHIHAVFSYTSVLAGVLANLRRIPYVVRPAGILQSWGIQARRTFAKRIHYLLLEKWILNRAVFVQAMSITEANELSEIGVNAPIEILYHGIDAPTTAAEALPLRDTADTAIPFLFLGRFHPIKGLDLLLPAFAAASAQEPRLVLLLAGDGDKSYKDWMRGRIQELAIEDHVYWPGFLQGEQKWSAISQCTAVVVPSYSENFGMVVAESMMCGTPVIVSESVGLAPEVSAAGAGLVVPCEVDALTHSILKLAHESNLRESMSANARALALQKFSLDQVTSDLIRSYEQYGGNNR